MLRDTIASHVCLPFVYPDDRPPEPFRRVSGSLADISPGEVAVLHQQGEYFATGGSITLDDGSTAAVDLVGKAPVDLGHVIQALSIAIDPSTTGAGVAVKINADDVNYTLGLLYAELTTTNEKTLNMTFNPIGLVAGTNLATATSTGTVSLIATSTLTAHFIVSGWRWTG